MRVSVLLALTLLLTSFGSSQNTHPKQPLFIVKQPTIIAFFEPVVSGSLDKDDDTNEALSDFQFYAGKVKPLLRKSGIEFVDIRRHFPS